MNKLKLKKYLIKEEKENFKLGEYLIPKIIYSPRTKGRVLDVEGYRNNSLSPKNISIYEKEFYKVFKGYEYLFIPEFPIPIFDKELWISVCKEKDIKEEIILNKSLISIDFFFHLHHIAIEIDGVQHWENKVQKKSDEVRDEYLKRKYNLKTYRLPQFTDSAVWKLKEIGKENPQQETPFKFSFWNEGIVDNWMLCNGVEVKAMDVLEKYKSQKNNIISIRLAELKRMFHKNLKPEDIEILKERMLKLYNKTIRLL